jgi:hypothetical protein
VVSESLFLEENELYSFVIFDIGGDGFCCLWGRGAYELTVGNRTVVASSGEIGIGRDHVFIASESDSDAFSPSEEVVPEEGDLFLTLVIKFDAYPGETGWVLRRVDSSATDSRSVNTLIAFQPPRLYSSDLANQEVSRFIIIPSGGEYTFDFTDSYGDGVCCQHGQVSEVVSVGFRLIPATRDSPPTHF